MKILGSLVIAFSMYSRIPMPRMEWTRERMEYALCFFPLVGLVQGLLLCLLFPLAQWLGGGQAFLQSVCGTVLPLLLTGGIHMDGFLDVSDARSSFGDAQKKLEILKDPHIGAFAVIRCGMYLLLYLGIFSMIDRSMLPAVGAVYVAERALSGWSVVSFPKAKKDGLAASFAGGARKRAVGVCTAVYLLWSLCIFWRTMGLLAACAGALAAAAMFAWYKRMAVREFGGVTGDLAGYFLQTAELALLAVIAVCGRLAV